MSSKTYLARIFTPSATNTMSAIEVPFDPKPAFGKVRAPVVVKIGRHTYRSTICAMGGQWWIPLRKSNREAAGIAGPGRARVTLTLDPAPRTVAVPADLRKAIKEAGFAATWDQLSYTHQREHVEAVTSAKKPETRLRRIESCLQHLGDRSQAVKKRAER